ncbi:nucleosome assembly [Perkinsus chesapeaki]|uniref:Nucleosome assembly n=1 Tax=Perkinsus chesapeaki TaxID=330153 RepID=A0A7J6LKQ4_PERCH|nr:nucleosome assembly [Perkinsus chesapeaki]
MSGPVDSTIIEKLDSLDQEYGTIRRQQEIETRALEKSYETKYAPLLSERAKIIADGAVPEFWLTVLRHTANFGPEIDDHDKEALKYLVDIQAEELSGEKAEDLIAGMKITFVFSENPYFENKTLSKTYHFSEVNDMLRHEIKCIDSDTVAWKAGKDLTLKTVVKKNKKTGATKTVQKETESFFRFFTPLGPDHPVPEIFIDDDSDCESDDDEVEERLQFFMSADFEKADDLKENIIPRAFKYFTGEAADYDSDEDELESDSESDDSEEADEEATQKRE